MAQITLLGKIQQQGLTCCVLSLQSQSIDAIHIDRLRNRVTNVLLIVGCGCFSEVGLIFFV